MSFFKIYMRYRHYGNAAAGYINMKTDECQKIDGNYSAVLFACRLFQFHLRCMNALYLLEQFGHILSNAFNFPLSLIVALADVIRYECVIPRKENDGQRYPEHLSAILFEHSSDQHGEIRCRNSPGTNASYEKRHLCVVVR